MNDVGFLSLMKGMIAVFFGFFWSMAALIGWWVATSGQGWIGLGMMFFVLIIEGIVYNAMTKPKKEKTEKKGRNQKRRRR